MPRKRARYIKNTHQWIYIKSFQNKITNNWNSTTVMFYNVSRNRSKTYVHNTTTFYDGKAILTFVLDKKFNSTLSKML